MCLSRFVVAAAIATTLCTTSARAAETDPLAQAFGKLPAVWGAQLSPDGSRISFLHMDNAVDLPVAMVLEPDGSIHPVIGSDGRRFDLNWCKWANNERLLCGYAGFETARHVKYPTTRLVAVDANGQNMKVLLQKQLRDKRAQFQDDVVDWMPDDPQNILIEVPDEGGSGVQLLNIYTGATRIEQRSRDNVQQWYSDNHGHLRLRYHLTPNSHRWYYRLAGKDDWQLLRESPLADLRETWWPVGFGADRDRLIVIKPFEGRQALWQVDLTGGRKDSLIFSHPEVDVGGPVTLGKNRRLVAVGYATEFSRLHFFDTQVQRLIERIARVLPQQSIGVIDESWDKRYYLIRTSTDKDPGQYYRFDTNSNELALLFAERPELAQRQLASRDPIHYPAADGVEIPAYLTLPLKREGKPLPTVILPHGGPQSRDTWDFDWLSQFLAAKGYAVLQSNFRGSGGFGESWAGEGGFRAWRTAVSDLVDGTHWLIEKGVSDKGRICIVGWSYGGYAALMSTIENPELFRCTVSIAGVTDPKLLLAASRKFADGKITREFIGSDEEVLERGSPLNRAAELRGPVLLFHGDYDLNVPVGHSETMRKALEKAKVENELIVFKGAEHGIWRERYRQELLRKLGTFLQSNIGER